MKEKTLLILAAGMGSRFGGLKQIEPVGPNGELIIEYSIYDAIKCGFNKVVFIIKKENYDLFKEKVGNKIEKHVNVEYVFQDVDDLPIGFENKTGRTKPWGTTHAILCAKDIINEPFLIINADDFYGREAFEQASNFIENNDNEKKYAIIGYKVKNTITENGSVKRGVCHLKENKISKIIESIIEKSGDKLTQKPILGEEVKDINPDSLVSMNLMVLYPNIFEYLEQEFIKFLKDNINSDTKESIIVEELSKAIENNFCEVIALETNAKWSGVTYKEDLEELQNFIKSQIEIEIYPEKL